jgi:hypothetical protein
MQCFVYVVLYAVFCMQFSVCVVMYAVKHVMKSCLCFWERKERKKDLDLCFMSGFERHNKVLDSTTTAVIHPYGFTKASVPGQSISLVITSRIPPK